MLSKLRHLGPSGLSAIFVQGGRLLLLLWLTHRLEGSAFGVLALLQLLVSLGIFMADGGLSNVYFAPKPPERPVLGTLLVFSVGLSIVISLLMLAVAYGLSDWMQLPEVFPLSCWYLPVLVILAAGVLPKGYLRRKMHFAALAMAESLAFLAALLLSVWAIGQGYGLKGLVWGYLLQYFLQTIAYWILAGKPAWPDQGFKWRQMPDYLQFGLFQIGERIVNFLAERADVFVVGKFLGPSVLGIYDVFRQMVLRPESLINPVFGQVAQSEMARVRQDRGRVGEIYQKYLCQTLLFNFTLLLIAFALAPWILNTFFGEIWQSYPALLRYCLLFALLHAIYNPVGALQMAIGRADKGFYWNLALFAMLTPAVGLAAYWGDIYTVIQVEIAVFIILMYPFYKTQIQPLSGLSGWTFTQSIFRPLIPAVLIALLAFAGLYLLH